MAKYLITGGAGFIGSNFVRRINEGQYQGISEVTILDKITYAGVIQNLMQVLSEERFNLIGDYNG